MCKFIIRSKHYINIDELVNIICSSYKINIDNLSIEQIIYTISYSTGSNDDVLIVGIIYVTIRVLIITFLAIIIKIVFKNTSTISLVIKGKKKRKINLFPIRVGIINSIVVLLLVLNYISINFSLNEYHTLLMPLYLPQT